MLRHVDGERVADNLQRAYGEFAPEFLDALVGFAFDDIYGRPGDLRQRELIAIASLATMGGCDPQLETHIHGAFNVGLSKQDVLEATMTLIPYIGFPKALNLLALLKRVCESRGC